MMDKRLLGKWGEALAAEYLRKKKYRLVAVNYYTRFGEVDIIAEKRGVLAFVEVKLRKNNDFASAREFVSPSKCDKIKMCAELWLSKNPTKSQPRFDVIEIYAPDGMNGRADIEHIENAFT